MLNRPYTIVFSTATIDGRIASSTGFSSLSCPYDLYRLRLLRGYADAVMVGAGTVLMDNPELLTRIGGGPRYYRVVVDGFLRLAEKAEQLHLLRNPDNVIVFTAADDMVKLEKLRKLGVRLHVVGSNGRVELARALQILYEDYGVEILLVEGGGRLNYSLIYEHVVDEVRLTIAPYMFGAGTSFIHDPEGKGFRDTMESPRLRLKCYELCPCGNCIHLVYQVLDASCCPADVEKPPPCMSSLLQKYVRRR